MNSNSNLFESFSLGQTTLNNRAGVAPMTRISASAEGVPTNQMLSYYKSFAEGGFGLVITEGNYIDDKYSQTYPNQPGIVFSEQVQAWKKIADAVHESGARIIMQLQHSGALSQGNRFNEGTLAPSAVQPKGEQLAMYLGEGPFQTPEEITQAEIRNVIDSFVQSAKNAQDAGFDGIEIHGANGYLLDGFLTDHTNRRTDEYGGSVKNRVRLSTEVSSAIREAVGQDFTVGIRISQAKVNDFSHKWAGKEHDAEVIFKELGQSGLDYIHVTEYKAWEPAFGTGPSLSALAKKYSKLPVIANGHLEDPENAENMIENGEADMITLGKGALANHDWVNKVKLGEVLETFDPKKFLQPDATIKTFEV